MDPSIPRPSIPFHFSSYGRSVDSKYKILFYVYKLKRFFFSATQTTSLFVTLAATIPNARTYSDVYFSKMPSIDFSDIMNAGNTTAKNGNIGDITLVPYSWNILKEKKLLEFD